MDERIITLICERCGFKQTDGVSHLVTPEYLVDDPFRAVGHLCPDCAKDDDPNHIPFSWLLSWVG